jgi:alpha-1,2-mannosyltransferase
MWNEHFGISIVEMMNAGLLTIAHNSGGPKSDTIVPYQGQVTGFLATTADEYAKAILEALHMSNDRAESIREASIKSAARYTDDVSSSACRYSNSLERLAP